MQRVRRASPTGPIWLFALALLLRAAMPFFATASAEAQGRAVGEICTVYGVAVDAKHHDAPATAHGGDHCALNALAALGTAAAPSPFVPSPRVAHREGPRVGTPSSRVDAVANWLARRKQGPPQLA